MTVLLLRSCSTNGPVTFIVLVRVPGAVAMTQIWNVVVPSPNEYHPLAFVVVVLFAKPPRLTVTLPTPFPSADHWLTSPGAEEAKPWLSEKRATAINPNKSRPDR